jgi:hypothetical protein
MKKHKLTKPQMERAERKLREEKESSRRFNRPAVEAFMAGVEPLASCTYGDYTVSLMLGNAFRQFIYSHNDALVLAAERHCAAIMDGNKHATEDIGDVFTASPPAAHAPRVAYRLQLVKLLLRNQRRVVAAYSVTIGVPFAVCHVTRLVFADEGAARE